MRFFDEGCRIVEWAVREKLRLPGPIPYSLQAEHKAMCRAMAYPHLLEAKVKNRARRLAGRLKKKGGAK